MIIATHVVSDIEYIARDIIMLKKGVIIDNAPPYELTKKIESKVWLVPCAESEVQIMQEQYHVINIAKTDAYGNNGVELRILAENMPIKAARTVVPALEDYYLYGDVTTAA